MPFSVQDRLDVIDLIANYGLTIDGHKIEAYLDNFTPDGVIEPVGERHAGREAIREWMHKRMRRIGVDPANPPGPTVRHFSGMPLINGIDGDHCSAQTTCVIFGYDKDKTVGMPLVATYTDDIVKVDGRWKFKHRVIHGDLDVRHLFG